MKVNENEKFEGGLENPEINGEELDEYDEEDIVTLVDDEGNEGEFQLLDFISYKDSDYAVLCSLDDDDSDRQEVVILKVDDDSDDEYQNFVTPDSDEEYDAVFDLFREKFKDVIDFEE